MAKKNKAVEPEIPYNEMIRVKCLVSFYHVHQQVAYGKNKEYDVEIWLLDWASNEDITPYLVPATPEAEAKYSKYLKQGEEQRRRVAAALKDPTSLKDFNI